MSHDEGEEQLRHHDPKDELPRMPKLATRIYDAIGRALSDEGIASSEEQRLAVLARMCGYQTWNRMASYVGHGPGKIRPPGPFSGARALSDAFAMTPSDVTRIAARIDELYDDRSPSFGGLAASIERNPALANVEVEGVRLKNGDARRLRAAGIATLGELSRRWTEMPPDHLGRILRRMVLPRTS